MAPRYALTARVSGASTLGLATAGLGHSFDAIELGDRLHPSEADIIERNIARARAVDAMSAWSSSRSPLARHTSV